MVDLIKFIINKITGSFEVEETTDEKGNVYLIHAKPDIIGLIIGKEGKTIKNIRRVAAIKAVLLDKSINISVTERV